MRCSSLTLPQLQQLRRAATAHRDWCARLVSRMRVGNWVEDDHVFVGAREALRAAERLVLELNAVQPMVTPARYDFGSRTR